MIFKINDWRTPLSWQPQEENVGVARRANENIGCCAF
jgi:hypothetical protein